MGMAKREWTPPKVSWEECCRRVLVVAEAKAAAGKATGVSDAAKRYARFGLAMLVGSHEQRVQANYLRGNIGSWFRDAATRAAVKAWAQVPPDWRPMPSIVMGSDSLDDAAALKRDIERSAN